MTANFVYLNTILDRVFMEGRGRGEGGRTLKEMEERQQEGRWEMRKKGNGSEEGDKRNELKEMGKRGKMGKGEIGKGWGQGKRRKARDTIEN